MPTNDQARWVVLIDKNPIGPLTEEQIRAKLTQGEVRPNDIAFLVPAGSTKPGSEWKFLWQFIEFDRRKSADGLANEPDFQDQDRRQERSQDEVRRALLSELPKEFHDMPTLVTEQLPPEPMTMVTAPMPEEGTAARDRGRSFRELGKIKEWATFAVAAIVAAVFTWKLFTTFMPTPEIRVPAGSHSNP